MPETGKVQEFSWRPLGAPGSWLPKCSSSPPGEVVISHTRTTHASLHHALARNRATSMRWIPREITYPVPSPADDQQAARQQDSCKPLRRDAHLCQLSPTRGEEKALTFPVTVLASGAQGKARKNGPGGAASIPPTSKILHPIARCAVPEIPGPIAAVNQSPAALLQERAAGKAPPMEWRGGRCPALGHFGRPFPFRRDNLPNPMAYQHLLAV